MQINHPWLLLYVTCGGIQFKVVVKVVFVTCGGIQFKVVIKICSVLARCRNTLLCKSAGLEMSPTFMITSISEVNLLY